MSDEKLELQTEFDAMLTPIKRKVFITIGVLVVMLVPFEIVLIFGFLADSGKLSLQSFHGFAVGLGGLIIFAVSMLLVLLPTKLMSYKAYQMSKAAADAASEMNTTVGQTAKDVQLFIVEGRAAFAELKNAASGTKLDELTLRFERKMDEAIVAFGPDELSEEEARAQAGQRIGKLKV